MNDENLHVLLGQIKGQLSMVIDNQQAHSDKIDAMNNRLNKVKHKVAFNGMITGGIAAVGVALLREKLGV